MCKSSDVCSLFKTISLLSQASPVPIRGRQAVVEIKRTTTRGNLKLTITNKIVVIHSTEQKEREPTDFILRAP